MIYQNIKKVCCNFINDQSTVVILECVNFIQKLEY